MAEVDVCYEILGLLMHSKMYYLFLIRLVIVLLLQNVQQSFTDEGDVSMEDNICSEDQSGIMGCCGKINNVQNNIAEFLKKHKSLIKKVHVKTSKNTISRNKKFFKK